MTGDPFVNESENDFSLPYMTERGGRSHTRTHTPTCHTWESISISLTAQLKALPPSFEQYKIKVEKKMNANSLEIIINT